MTSSSPEHYQNLVKHKIKNMIVCLHLSGFDVYEAGVIHTKAAKLGVTWVTVATRHDIWLPKLLQLNNAQYEDLVIPGQFIKVQ